MSLLENKVADDSEDPSIVERLGSQVAWGIFEDIDTVAVALVVLAAGSIAAVLELVQGLAAVAQLGTGQGFDPTMDMVTVLEKCLPAGEEDKTEVKSTFIEISSHSYHHSATCSRDFPKSFASKPSA